MRMHACIRYGLLSRCRWVYGFTNGRKVYWFLVTMNNNIIIIIIMCILPCL